jgi:hypothetical protein
MRAGLPRKLRNREFTGKQLQYALDLSTNPKLWDLILPRDLREWETELDLIDTLGEMRFHKREMIDHPDCKETLQDCTTLAERLTSSQDLCEAHTSDLESQHNLSHNSIFRLGQSIGAVHEKVKMVSHR